MYDDVLVATDGSDVAARATRQGLAIAADVDARVHALSVVDVREGPGLETVREQARDDCRRIVDAVADDEAARDVPVVTTVRDGRPHHEILAYADEEDVDLLVVGTRGRTGVRRWLLGSVAIGVIRHARRPVLTVGSSAASIPRRFERILVATDGRSGTNVAVEHGLDLARTFDATLHALSVVDDVHSKLPVVLEAFERQGEEATADVADRAAERGVEAVRAVERGIPHEAITEYVDEHGIDLVVVGTESRTGLDRVAVGSVSQRVVGRATAPVVTVRSTE